METVDWLTIIAIIVGPLSAVLITLWSQQRAERRNRRLDIFRTLMRTRRTQMTPDHVGALNLIEIEFAGETNVIHWWKKLFEHFGTEHPRRPEEQLTSDLSQIEINTRNNAFGRRILEERQRILAKMLHAVANILGFKIEQLEIFEGGYTPQGWADIEIEQQEVRRTLIQVLSGARPLQVSPATAPALPSLFPPPPASSDDI